MSNLFDGLSNVESITAKINALKKAQENGATTAPDGVDPDTFILQTQQNFNDMLNSLMVSPDEKDQSSSSDPFSFMTDSSQNTLQSQIQSLTNSTNTGAQNLTALEQNSPLLGKVAIYQDQTGAQLEGVISKILLDKNGAPVIVLNDGLQIAASAIIGIKQ
ncbi:MAG: hypothetical protein PHG97_07180, partial [Candidatus Margulisbacteria bacterium]|nr:hypothetical protein [Candidatus Margulisiibacteriota bacterium]